MIKIKSHTTDNGKDKVKKLMSVLEKSKGAYVTIGIHEGAGSYPDGKSVVQVALWNEFGTEHIPSRPFFRSSIDGNEALINKWREEMIENIVSKGWPVKKCLEAIGLRVQILIQNKIKSNMPPPNAPRTIAQKQKDGVAAETLIHSGLMLRSVTFKVHT